MKLSTVFTLSAILLGLLGAGLLFAPSPLISMRTGQAPGELTQHIARQFGTLALALAYIAWRMRSAKPPDDRKAVTLGLTLAFIILPIETALSIFSGAETSEGWVLVAIFALLALGFITAKDQT